MSCITRIIIYMLIATGLGVLLYNGCIRRDRWGWRIGPEVTMPSEVITAPGVTTPPGWKPYGGSVAGPEVIEAPSTEYTAGDTTTPVEPKKQPRHPLIAPPGTLGEGGDVRDLIPWIEFTGPEPGSAGSEACEE